MIVDKISRLWHKKFDHLNFHNLLMRVANGMVIVMPEIFFLVKTCEECLLGKQPRNVFKSHMHMREKEVLHVVY